MLKPSHCPLRPIFIGFFFFYVFTPECGSGVVLFCPKQETAFNKKKKKMASQKNSFCFLFLFSLSLRSHQYYTKATVNHLI